MQEDREKYEGYICDEFREKVSVVDYIVHIVNPKLN